MLYKMYYFVFDVNHQIVIFYVNQILDLMQVYWLIQMFQLAIERLTWEPLGPISYNEQTVRFDLVNQKGLIQKSDSFMSNMETRSGAFGVASAPSETIEV